MLSVKGILLLTMFLAGGLAAAQGALNTQLANHIGSPFQASFISFCIGAFVLGLYLVVSKQNLPAVSLLRQVPIHYLLGGLCGSIFITCMIFLIPRIGIVNVLFLGLAGQMIVSVAIDSFGLLGLKQHPLGVNKILGVFIILAGVALLNYDARQDKAAVDSSKTVIRHDASPLNNAVQPANAGLGKTAADYSNTAKLRDRREKSTLRQTHKRAARALMARRHGGDITHLPT